jgi:hypothetical protein
MKQVQKAKVVGQLSAKSKYVEDRNQAEHLNHLIGEGLKGRPYSGSAGRLREIAAKAR